MPDRLPFDGLKVVDFSWVVVGPGTAKHFADHGATAVRVETPAPMDILRTATPFKDNVPGPDRSQFFGEFNTSKFGVTLDLKNPAGIGIAHRLISWADILIEAFTPGTVDRLGIGYSKAHALNPSIIMVSTCLMGQTGPAASFAGYGFHSASIAGMYEVTGWPDLPPDGPWLAYTDTIAPHFLIATVMAALDHRRRTGQGQHIDASQLEMALHFMAPQTINFRVSGDTVSRIGNRSPTAAPQGAYPCKGDDQWCTIAVENDEQWEALRRAIGDPLWAQDGRFDTVQGRLAHHDEIDMNLAQWTSSRPPREVMNLLQAEGVPAGVVQRSSDLLHDPQLAHRDFFRNMDHPEMGNIPYTGHAYHIGGYDHGPRCAAPVMGQHNEMVLKDLLGMSADEIAEAIIGGALG
jgi:crotonobetainyl-CoA:carnitine CoA-transferase CaiB-like acyl-CoA transferase